MLRRWLASMPLSDFVARHLGRLPHAQPGTATCAVPCFDWDVLERVLASRPPDVLVAARGRLVEVPPPRDLGDVRRLMRAGLGLVIRKSERQDPALAQLAREFALDLPGELHIQLYVTPAGTHTFGWHYDWEDVFIAQTVGTKDYHFRDNTVASDVPFSTRPDFSSIRRETSPMFGALLIPGDWLYIPRRWWHLVRSLEDSLSISVGVVPREPAAASHALAPGAPGAGYGR